MPRRGKKYQDAAQMRDADMKYALKDAVALAVGTSTTKFDSSVEVHLNLDIDPKQADQQLRSTVSLPHGTGKTVKVAAFVGDDKVAAAKEAGAIEAGNEELIKKVEGGWMDFDVAVATPDMMKDLSKVARVLGPAGKMPNPKSGTVTPDVEKAIGDIMKGQVEFRNDKTGNLHNVVGKVSFGEDKVLENVLVYLKAILDKKPSGVKGTYISSITLATTMGPGVKVDVNDAMASL